MQQSDSEILVFPSVIFTKLSLYLTLCLTYDRIRKKTLQGGIRLFTHKCEMCGMEFQSKSNRAKYCIYCRDKAQTARNRAYAEKKKSGTSVPLGSEQKCPVCGHFVVQLTRADKGNNISSIRLTNAKARKFFQKLKSKILYEEKVFDYSKVKSTFYLNYNEFGVKKRCYSNLRNLKLGKF